MLAERAETVPLSDPASPPPATNKYDGKQIPTVAGSPDPGADESLSEHVHPAIPPQTGAVKRRPYPSKAPVGASLDDARALLQQRHLHLRSENNPIILVLILILFLCLLYLYLYPPLPSRALRGTRGGFGETALPPKPPR